MSSFRPHTDDSKVQELLAALRGGGRKSGFLNAVENAATDAAGISGVLEEESVLLHTGSVESLGETSDGDDELVIVELEHVLALSEGGSNRLGLVDVPGDLGLSGRSGMLLHPRLDTENLLVNDDLVGPATDRSYARERM